MILFFNTHPPKSGADPLCHCHARDKFTRN
jgi:hypothetical protein